MNEIELANSTLFDRWYYDINMGVVVHQGFWNPDSYIFVIVCISTLMGILACIGIAWFYQQDKGGQQG